MLIDLKELFSDYDAQITWDTFYYDTEKSFQQHCDDFDFSDDLFQADIHPNQNLVLDIGVPRWFQPNACFIIYVIQDWDWDKPLKKVCTNDIHILIQEIKLILVEYSLRLLTFDEQLAKIYSATQ